MELHELDKVTWSHRPRGGYGYTIPVAAVVEKIGARSVQIRVAEKIGGRWQRSTRWVAPAALGPREMLVPAVDGDLESDA
jgi:hypothetical protein